MSSYIHHNLHDSAELSFIVGLPGSGKSYYAKSNFKQHAIFDDSYFYRQIEPIRRIARKIWI